MKRLFFCILITYSSCGPKTKKHKINPVAVGFNNKAVDLVRFIDYPDSCFKAISLLDSATKIDNNYFLAYWNKLMFFHKLKQIDNSILTVKNLIRIKPYAHDVYIIAGVLHERTGDTISSSEYFQKSLKICNNVLDTMSVTNKDYEMILMNKAINLTMIGEQIKGNKTFEKLYEVQTDNNLKEIIKSMMNKNKKEMLETFKSY